MRVRGPPGGWEGRPTRLIFLGRGGCVSYMLSRIDTTRVCFQKTGGGKNEWVVRELEGSSAFTMRSIFRVGEENSPSWNLTNLSVKFFFVFASCFFSMNIGLMADRLR